ncbi:MAG: hypothetical protein MJZ05_05300 [Fibrobacter sp.]|nr:hypothetical protein [Fibrobacter sp.]MCQ2122901.1 hypothetical protein [Fibrobacter sp.]
MKKLFTLCAICVASLALSGCAILLGVNPMTNIHFGGLHVFTRVSTAYYYLVTDNPEEVEVDLPFHSTNRNNRYQNVFYNKNKDLSSITFYNDEIRMIFQFTTYEKIYERDPNGIPQGLSEKQKIDRIISNFFNIDSTDKSVRLVYDAEKKMGYKCFSRSPMYDTSKDIEDVCGAVRFSRMGNVAFFYLVSSEIGAEQLKETMLKTANSVQFKAEQQ